jgi:putative acetyltransferase
MFIRPEQESDHDKIYALNVAAFGGDVEALLVNSLRKKVNPLISLVAENNCGELIGHIMFSPVTLTGFEAIKLMGLAPMAVLPIEQKKGYGSALINAGVKICKNMGYGAIFVLGHADYYPRFGFKKSANFGILSDYDVPPEYFMILELQKGALNGATGKIKYHAAFNDLE